MADWYCNFGDGSTTGYYAVAQWAATHTYAAGAIVRQLATPTVGNERCFRTAAGLTSGGSEPAWTLTHGGNTMDNGGTWTEVTGNSTYNWSAPFARIQTPINQSSSSWLSSGDRLFIGDNHAETNANAITYGGGTAGTAASPVEVICVNHSGSVPPVSADLRTTAAVTTTGANNISFASGGTLAAYFYGIIFTAGSGSAATVTLNFGTSAPFWIRLDSCKLAIASTGASSGMNITGGSNITAKYLDFLNTPLSFAATGQNMTVQSTFGFRWRNTASALSGTIPTTLIASGSYGLLLWDGVDLSGASTGKTLIASGGVGALEAQLLNCKLDPSVTVASTPTVFKSTIDQVISDSSGTTYNAGRIQYPATQTTDTSNTRSSGAADPTGQGYSWKIVTNSNASQFAFFESFPVAVWNATTGSSVTATIEIINDGTTLTNADIWVEFEVLSNSSSTLSSMFTTAPADILASSSNITSSSVTWTTSGITTPIKQKMSTSFTPRVAGLVRGTVKVAKASKTIWVDPLITLS